MMTPISRLPALYCLVLFLQPFEHDDHLWYEDLADKGSKIAVVVVVFLVTLWYHLFQDAYQMCIFFRDRLQFLWRVSW